MVAAVSSQINTEQSTVHVGTVSTVARKRRRQILQTLRETKTSAGASANTSPSPSASASSEPYQKKQCVRDGSPPVTSPQTIATEADPPRARKVSHCEGIVPPVNASAIQKALESDDPKSKRPQMRYEPDVPMTKEEATAWRREQRRKRNRESAAASRQRQRDRISELEVEVDDWKVKYKAALDRLKRLESLHGMPGSSTVTSGSGSESDAALTVSAPQDDSVAVSPCPSPNPSHSATPNEVLSSTFLSSQGPSTTTLGNTSSANVTVTALPLESQLEEKEEHLKENYPLPAL
jgi:hypothetical protein